MKLLFTVLRTNRNGQWNIPPQLKTAEEQGKGEKWRKSTMKYSCYNVSSNFKLGSAWPPFSYSFPRLLLWPFRLRIHQVRMKNTRQGMRHGRGIILLSSTIFPCVPQLITGALNGSGRKCTLWNNFSIFKSFTIILEYKLIMLTCL